MVLLVEGVVTGVWAPFSVGVPEADTGDPGRQPLAFGWDQNYPR